MSTVKISQLPQLNTLNNNTDLTVFLGLDLSSDITGKLTATTLARGLYSNNSLIVGSNPINYPNVIGQFSGSSNTYIQVNLQNFNANGTSDYVATTSDSDNNTKFIDMGIVGPNYNNTNYTAYNPYDGYIYTVGSSSTSSSGNLIINSASSNANILFVVGGYLSNNIIATVSNQGFSLNTNMSLVFGDGTIQNTASLPANYSTSAYAQANTASANTIYLQGGLNTANANISYILAYGLTANANASALNVYTQQVYSYANAISTYSTSAYNQANTASANTVYLQGGLNTANANASALNVYTQQVYSYANAVNTYAVSAYAKANTAVQNTAVIQLNSLSLSGNLTTNGTITPQKGFIWTPTSYSGAQTAITVDFANNSVIRTQMSSTLTMTLTNFVTGKEVNAWITNTAGGAQTFNHGVSATNSTVNATNYSIPGTSTIFVKYWCADGTLTNTYCAIIHA